MKHRLLFLVSICLGCGNCSPEVATAPEPEVAPVEPQPEPQPIYDLHEWGLIDASARAPGIELSAGPGHDSGLTGLGLSDLGLQGYGKPVLYFHVDGELDEFEVRLEVSLPDALELAEHYPPGELDSAQRSDWALRWDMRLRNAPCSSARSYPAIDGEHCTGVSDGYCEASELADYETLDASCIEVDDSEWPLLFYRGSPRQRDSASVPFDGLPLEASVGEEGTVTVRNRRTPQTMQPGIGRIWRVVHSPTGPLVTSVDWPSPGDAVEIARPESDEELPLARAMVASDLNAHGLLPSEVHAFEEAWMEVLFGAPAEARNEVPSGVPSEDRRGSVGGELIGLGNAESPRVSGSGRSGAGGFIAPPPPDVLLYWMPPADVDSLAHLELTPAPRALRRAALIRVNLLQ